MDKNALFLDVAYRIGTRTVDQALWDDDACTWMVNTPDTSTPGVRRVLTRKAEGSVYQGTAGNALFLSRLYHYTQDARIGQAAEGALRYALKEAEGLPEIMFGFHNGRVGIAYAAILAPMAGQEALDRGIDVIGGAAGAIPALLQMAEVLDPDLVIGMATRLGDHLLNTAHREPVGWSWTTTGTLAVRHLTGLAHGVAGEAHALLELYVATGSDQYLYAAEQGFLYERQCFNAEAANWPDYRHHTVLMEYMSVGQLDTVKAVLRAGEQEPYEDHWISAWCHGAPGIGLTRLRAFEVLGHPSYRQEAEVALGTTLAAPEQNYSLCHGVCGNSETLLYASEVLGDPSFRQQAEAYGLQGWEAHEKVGEPWSGGRYHLPPRSG